MVNKEEYKALFPEMPDSSRLWIFQSVEPFKLNDHQLLELIVRPFLAQWKAHQQQVLAKAEILYDHFLVVVADESQTPVSGCAGDALHHMIQDVALRMEKNLLDRLALPIITNHRIHFYSRKSILNAIADGELSETLLLIDPTVKTLGEWKNRWIVPLKGSWVATLKAPARY
ncbi:MAG: hypothetical protein KA479_01360 [Saprospiraceae bacterium]|nr:hypothetical protein [Saprospiraceae bacterium]